jgi:hypothetical protein
MRRFSYLCAALALAAPAVAGEMMRTVREPTAGIVAPRTYYVSMSTFPSNGLRFSLYTGIVPGLMVGLGYGGWDVTGLSSPDWFDHVFAKVRFRFLDETTAFPALAIGYDNEDEAVREAGTYTRTSRGLYMAASKNFRAPGGDMGFHGGISVSFDEPDHAGCWLGMDKSLPAGFGIAADYDFATNEADSVRFDKSGGFLNCEVYWESFGQVRVSLQFLDMLDAGGASYRSLAVDFLGLF